MFRFGMFVACSGFVAVMIHTAYTHQLERELSLEYAAPVASLEVVSSGRIVEPMDMIASSPERMADVDKAKVSVAEIRQKPKVKMEKIDIGQASLLVVDGKQAEASAKAYTAIGPDGQPLEVFVYDQQWKAYAKGMGRDIASKKGYTARFFRIRPVGYTPSAQLGATKYAGRYTLKSEEGLAFNGEIVGFVGRTDVVCFFVPNETVVEVGKIQVADPAFKVTSGQIAE
jgi:hypothetical protein